MTEQENRQQHFASFVGMQLSTVCFDLRFMSYDPEKNEMVPRLYGGPHDYIESRGTPEKIAKENHFSGKLRGIFFNMDYRNISHPCLPEKVPQPKRKILRKTRRESSRLKNRVLYMLRIGSI